MTIDINSSHVEFPGGKVYTVKDWSRMLRQLRLKGYTALHVAVIHSEIKTIEALIENGANVDCVDLNNICPLNLAAAVQRPDVVRLLIKNGKLSSPL